MLFRSKDFFGEFLGVKPETAARDACEIEHLISRETMEKIEKQLAHGI